MNCEKLDDQFFKNTLLSHLSDPPKSLFAKGNLDCFKMPCLAIVGTRRPSNYGLRCAFTFSKTLAEQGFCIISGLARGVDTAAHWGALKANGRTIAVLGHGLDRIYPTENRVLAEEILDKGGCLLSEYPIGTPPLPHHFPTRNRLISGLSLGVIVVEAAKKSGSLITARLAAEQGREVFVLPGLSDDTGFMGSHWLIQQGAKLVTHTQEVLEELPNVKPHTFSQSTETIAFLADIFGRLGGSAVLEDLFSESNLSLGSLVNFLDLALKLGKVVEITPQHYLWVQENSVVK